MLEQDNDDRWMRTILLGMGIVALCCLGGAIIAKADGSLKDFRGAPAATAPLGFRTGCYLKAHGQGSFVDHAMTAGGVEVDGLSGKSFGGGIGGGCDYISQQFLIGLGADYTFQNPEFTASVGPTTMTIPLGNEWSIFGRLGWLANPYTALYVLGGYAGAQDNSLKMTGLETTLTETLGNRRGPVVGGGVEWLMSQYITGSLEYRHNAFGESTTTGLIPMKLDTNEDVIRVGLSLRWQ